MSKSYAGPSGALLQILTANVIGRGIRELFKIRTAEFGRPGIERSPPVTTLLLGTLDVQPSQPAQEAPTRREHGVARDGEPAAG